MLVPWNREAKNALCCSKYSNQIIVPSISPLSFFCSHISFNSSKCSSTIIVGDVKGGFGSYYDGHELYEKAASKDKDILVLEGVIHYDLYDQPEPVKKAVSKLENFYKKYL